MYGGGPLAGQIVGESGLAGAYVWDVSTEEVVERMLPLG